MPASSRASDGQVHAARVRGGLVLLDAERDSYQALYLPADGDGHDGDEDARNAPGVAALLDLAAPSPTVPAAPGEPVWMDCEPDPRARPRMGDAILFLACLLLSTLIFHTRSFAVLVASARLRHPRPAPPLADYAVAIARFQALANLLPFRMQCLFRANFLRLFLYGLGLPADWVFGVSLFPFHAHCWIAVGRAALLERAEKLEDFTPILLVRNVAETRP